jgi:hypothetical protein
VSFALFVLSIPSACGAEVASSQPTFPEAILCGGVDRDPTT